MFGERARLGLIVPSSNTTVEPELATFLPAGVDAFATRVYQEETDDPAEKVRTVLAMRAGLDSAVRNLASVQPATIGYACTAGSFLSGLLDDVDTCSRLTASAGIPVMTASRAVLAALAALKVDVIGMATPYLEAINAREVGFLNEAGVSVVKELGLGIVGNLPKGRLPAQASYDAATAADDDSAHGIFISCTNWRTIENIAQLSVVLGKPVVSSNSALLWALCRLGGIDDDLPALGPLGDLPLPTTFKDVS